MSGDLTPADLADILAKYARKLLGDVSESAITLASDAHPLLESLATDLLGCAFDERTLAKLQATLEAMLRELLGDDYPLVIDAQTVVIEDDRTPPAE